MTSQQKAEPFRVTGPGKYRTRNGKLAIVVKADDQGRWIGGIDPEKPEHKAWNEDGTNLFVADTDLIARLDDEPAEMAGQRGFISSVTEEDGTEYAYLHATKEAAFLSAGAQGKVWDLSQLPASALVKPPEPKTETRKVWLIFAAGGGVEAYEREPPTCLLEGKVAIVEREITFTHGEGMKESME